MHDGPHPALPQRGRGLFCLPLTGRGCSAPHGGGLVLLPSEGEGHQLPSPVAGGNEAIRMVASSGLKTIPDAGLGKK